MFDVWAARMSAWTVGWCREDQCLNHACSPKNQQVNVHCDGRLNQSFFSQHSKLCLCLPRNLWEHYYFHLEREVESLYSWYSDKTQKHQSCVPDMQPSNAVYLTSHFFCTWLRVKTKIGITESERRAHRQKKRIQSAWFLPAWVPGPLPIIWEMACAWLSQMLLCRDFTVLYPPPWVLPDSTRFQWNVGILGNFHGNSRMIPMDSQWNLNGIPVDSQWNSREIPWKFHSNSRMIPSGIWMEFPQLHIG